MGIDLTDDNYGLTDPNGHGTHVAGIIGAVGNNTIGIAGINWSIQMVPIRVLDVDNTGYSDWTAEGINYAATKHIKLLNLSLGSYNYNPNVELAVDNYPGLLVCAAGNKIKDTDLEPHYPSYFNVPNLISVGATNDTDNLWVKQTDPNDPPVGSNFGLTTVDLFAPGEDIYSTYKNDTIIQMSGTSMSTPMVTGVAQLLRCINPSLTPSQLKNIILNNVDTVSGLATYCVTGGILDASKAADRVNSYLLGLNTKAPYGATTGSNMFNAVKAVASSSMTVDTISLYVENPLSGNVRLGLYNDGGGFPNFLIAQTGDIPLAVSPDKQWASGTISTVSISSGTTYWLAFNFSTSGGPYDNEVFYTGGGMTYSGYYTYGALPSYAPFLSSSFAATFSIFASKNN